MPPAQSALPRPSSPPPAPPQPVRRRPARPAPSRRSTEPTPPQERADKRRTEARGGGSYTGYWVPARGRFTRCLGAPRPWAPPPDRRTAGQWAPAAAQAGRAGALRDRPPAGRGWLQAGPAVGRRGEARRTDKANGRQTDGGGKRWRRGQRERAARALAASGARAGASPLSAAAAAPTPPGFRGARLALWAGPQGKGPGRRDLGSIQSLAFQRGPALVLLLETPAEHLCELWVVHSPLRAALGRVNSTQLSSPLVSYTNIGFSHKTHIPQPQLHRRLPPLRSRT